MKYFSKISVLVLMLTVLCLFVGCQTGSRHERGLPLNLSGVNKVGIVSNNSQVGMRFSRKLVETGKFTIASAAELQDWQRWDNEQGAIVRQRSELERRHQQQQELFNQQAQVQSISAANLAREYQANEPRADQLFSGRQLKVTGAIAGIERDSQGSPFIRLTGVGNDSVIVFFNLSETNKVMALNRGNTITIIGECSGRNVPDGQDTSEILRILGGGRPIHIDNAVFQITTPAALPPAPRVRNYTGTIDAVIHLNAVSSPPPSSVSYRIVRAQDGSNLGSGRAVNTGIYVTKPDQSHYDGMLDTIITQMINAIPQSQ